MRRFFPLVLAAVVSPFLLGAGCGGEIAFHGSGGGEDKSEYSCRQGAELKVTWRGESGSLTVTTYDPAAEVTQFTRTFVPTGVDQNFTQAFPGVSRYTVTVTRTSDWKGAYTVNLACK